MRISNERFTCQACTHVFDAELVLDAPIAVTVAAIKALHCPKCGESAEKIGFGGSHGDAPGKDSPVAARASWWIERGSVGTSSLTIWCAFTGGSNPHRHFNYPLDPDDFSRCHALLRLIPEWRADLGRVTARFPWFKPFEDRWAQFEALWREELASGACHKLYDLMQVACREAEKLRGGRQ